ncbi:MAG TPA: hypothetical protein VN604_06795 [Nitrospirota bacterium]|nr:hypothetical protein [Nitrospirota bacterium]
MLIPLSSTASGVVAYADKQYNQNGFTGTLTSKAVRFAEIEVVNSFTNAVLASTSTDSSGAYNLSYTSFVGYPVKLRVIASAALFGSPVAEVQNLQGQVYAVTTAVTSPTVNITVSADSPAGGAFNILDVLTSGTEFVSSQTGAYPPEVVAYWDADSSAPYGTAYCSGVCTPGPGIFIIGNRGGDTDGYDDDVIWHEYGHFIAETYSRDDSQGGFHALGQNNLDLRLAWSEGWADFFPGAIKSWMRVNDPARKSSAAGTPDSYYVDTVGDTWQISFDFGEPPATDAYMYSSSETGVAKVLWDLFSQFPTASLWSVIDTYIPTVAAPANLESFWDGWYSIYGTDGAAIASSRNILNGRNIFYEEDTLEADGTFGTARAVTTQLTETHYLYQPADDDHDFVSFTAVAGQQYTVRTVNLKNRVYPTITVYRTDQSSVLAAGLNSVLFTPATAETVYIEVKPYLARPSSYGRYGTYTLTIN